jgi:hypothetical protein
MPLRRNLGEAYSPLYFLAALGNGGLAITFFVYLQFMVPHRDTPLVTFEAIAAQLSLGYPMVFGLIILAMAGILYFTYRFVRMLVWNLVEYRTFRRTGATRPCSTPIAKPR